VSEQATFERVRFISRHATGDLEHGIVLIEDEARLGLARRTVAGM
jgi:hypothetical protein